MLDLPSRGAVDEAMRRPGTTLVLIDSECECSAQCAHPGLRLSLEHPRRPDHLVRVDSTTDAEALARAREYFVPYPESAPMIVLMGEGMLLAMFQREDLDGRSPEEVAGALQGAYDRFCGQ